MSIVKTYTESTIDYSVNGTVCMTYWNGHVPLDMVEPNIVVVDDVVYAFGRGENNIAHLCKFENDTWTGTLRDGEVGPLLRIFGEPAMARASITDQHIIIYSFTVVVIDRATGKMI